LVLIYWNLLLRFILKTLDFQKWLFHSSSEWNQFPFNKTLKLGSPLHEDKKKSTLGTKLHTE
jgi:hypothetical protein